MTDPRALRLGRHLGLGERVEGEEDRAVARLHARFSRALIERPPGVDVVTFARGAVWRERGGETWRPVPAALPASASFFEEGYAPLVWAGEDVLREAERRRRGEPTWAHAQDLSRPELDDLVARMVSHEGPVRVDPRSGLPLNPSGPTGLAGRGVTNLGPVRAQDLLLVSQHDDGRWFGVLIQRRDNGRWAMPGGIEDEDDRARRMPTAVREFLEETYGPAPPLALREAVMNAFAAARLVYQGVCPLDARNTDNAWFETEAYLAELPWSVASALPLLGSDDAKGAALVELTPALVGSLHGDHPGIVAAALDLVRGRAPR